jgi:hypothetical protein
MAASDYPLVQVATWNDWAEGTAIEPSREYGYQYVELTREWSARWRRTEALTGNLRVPAWIYVLRKTSRQQKALDAAKAASAAIQAGDFAEAERVLKPSSNRSSWNNSCPSLGAPPGIINWHFS